MRARKEVAQIINREYERWMMPAGADGFTEKDGDGEVPGEGQ